MKIYNEKGRLLLLLPEFKLEWSHIYFEHHLR